VPLKTSERSELNGRVHPITISAWFGALVEASAQAVPPDAPERRYALREVKARLHQVSFRDAVLTAYGGFARKIHSCENSPTPGLE